MEIQCESGGLAAAASDQRCCRRPGTEQRLAQRRLGGDHLSFQFLEFGQLID